MRILQFIGYKNSGKTTLLDGVLQRLLELGYTVGTIKHHGHTTPFTKPLATDGERFFNSGAAGSALISADESIVYLNTAFSVVDILGLYESKKFDWVLIEGFKTLSYDKIVLAREDQDFPIIDNNGGKLDSHALYLRGENRTADAVFCHILPKKS